MIRSNAFEESIQEEALDAMLEGGFEEEEQPSGASASEAPEEPLQRLSDDQNTEFVGAIKQVAANHRTLNFPIDLGESPVMVSDLKQKMFEERPKFVISSILMMLLVVVFLAFHFPSIQFDTSTESFFEKDDPTLLEYDAFREQFGRDEIVLALIHPKDVFEITFLEKLKAFHQELEETVPHLDEVRSLVNVTSMRGEEGELIIEELMEDWPETEEEIVQLRKRMLDNKIYRNFLVSEDGFYTAVMIR